MTETWCWCCARWALSVPAAEGRDTCVRCANSSPSACDKRHLGEALRAGNAAVEGRQRA